MAANIGETAAQQSQQAQQARGTALVLGVSGGIGGEVARQLSGAGWRVRALQRKPGGDAVRAGGIETVQGDVMDRDAVMRAAQGCEVIVHAVNPPGYRRWAELVLPMIDNTLAAAQAARATVVLPGTVYNYGPAALPLVAEDAPQQPRTRKGAIRVELERRIEAATAREVRAIVLRAGDFFGPRVGNSWLAQGFLTPGQPLRAVREPGTPGVGHCWGYVPDVARAMLELIEQRAALAPFARFHMAGHWDADGTQMVAAICRVAARHGLTIKRLSVAVDLRGGALFNHASRNAGDALSLARDARTRQYAPCSDAWPRTPYAARYGRGGHAGGAWLPAVGARPDGCRALKPLCRRPAAARKTQTRQP
jgi:nucleoside-diphosphate-sugar epimerase